MKHYLQDFAKCQTKEQLDQSARRHADKNCRELNKTDRAVLEMIRCYSVKYLAAHLKHETFEKKLGVSNSTVRRALRKLEKLGMIERISFIRPVMNGLGANIYIILPFADQSEMNSPPAVEKPCCDAVKEDISAAESPSFKTSKPIQKIKTSLPKQKSSSNSLYAKMEKTLSLTGDVSKLREFYIIYRSLSCRMLKFSIHEGKEQLFEELADRAMYTAVMAVKKKNIRNLPGYFSGVLRKMIDEELFEDIHEEYSVGVEEFYCPF